MAFLCCPPSPRSHTNRFKWMSCPRSVFSKEVPADAKQWKIPGFFYPAELSTASGLCEAPAWLTVALFDITLMSLSSDKHVLHSTARSLPSCCLQTRCNTVKHSPPSAYFPLSSSDFFKCADLVVVFMFAGCSKAFPSVFRGRLSVRRLTFPCTDLVSLPLQRVEYLPGSGHRDDLR